MNRFHVARGCLYFFEPGTRRPLGSGRYAPLVSSQYTLTIKTTSSFSLRVERFLLVAKWDGAPKRWEHTDGDTLL
jgi:hypothetical protein